mgnify:CR=1 FL=1
MTQAAAARSHYWSRTSIRSGVSTVWICRVCKSFGFSVSGHDPDGTDHVTVDSRSTMWGLSCDEVVVSQIHQS